MLVAGILIILGEAFPNFSRSSPHHGVEVRVVVRVPPEDLDSEGKWPPMSRPFFGRNKLEIGGSAYLYHPTLLYGVLCSASMWT